MFSTSSLDEGISQVSESLDLEIRPNVLFVLIWVQTVCKGYEQTTLACIEFIWYKTHDEKYCNNIINPLSACKNPSA